MTKKLYGVLASYFVDCLSFQARSFIFLCIHIYQCFPLLFLYNVILMTVMFCCLGIEIYVVSFFGETFMRPSLFAISNSAMPGISVPVYVYTLACYLRINCSRLKGIYILRLLCESPKRHLQDCTALHCRQQSGELFSDTNCTLFY